MPQLHPSHIIEAFLDNGRNLIWRVEWFGEVDLNPQVPSEPTIEVTLIPLREPEINPYTIYKESAYKADARRLVRVGVGLLPCLYIGSLWQGGKQLETPKFAPWDFNELLITPQTARITDSYQEPGMITEEFYPAASSCVKAKYLVVDLDAERHDGHQHSKLIIPCVEVARFYYMTSTQLSREIISGGLATNSNNVFDPRRTRRPGEDGVGFVQLRPTTKDINRNIVGRMALSKIANRNARNINSSLIRNALEYDCAVLEARPPFEGYTDLKVQGRWLRDVNGSYHYLVYQIVSCTAPFPFDQLDWGRDNDGTSAGEKDKSRPIAYAGGVKRPVRLMEQEESERLITSVEEPSLDYEVVNVELESDRFPDLRNKRKGKKLRNLENYTRAGQFRSNKPEAITRYSTGAGDHKENKVAPFSVTQREQAKSQEAEEKDRKARLPAGFGNFNDILRELEKLGNITASLVLLDAASKDTVIKSCTFFPIVGGRKPIKWSYIDYHQGHRRQAMIAHIKYDNYHFYLIDAEVKEDDPTDRYSMLLLYDSAGLTEVNAERLRAVLHFAVLERGRWIHDWEFKNLAKERFRHDYDAASKYASNFFNYMQKIIRRKPAILQEISSSEEETSEHIMEPNKIA
jgi:hypothetical protein